VNNTVSVLIIVLIVTNFYLLNSSRLRAMIRAAAFQGLLLGLIPFIIHTGHISTHTFIIGISGIILKGLAIPYLLFRAIRGVEEYREKPSISYNASIAFGVFITAAAFWIIRYIPISTMFPSPALTALAISMAAVGLFLIMARTLVLTQVIGYLVLENAIYTFGNSLSANQSLMVELGVLLDLLVGMFIMGIVIYHINREFDSITSESLEELKE